ncbi:[Skp1-protein]-hydroxyproline N-acetylglucosaminyltransferase (Glycosyltransferase GnT51) (Skp1-HyPro GlcNAc-transferase) (UDP-GlcNAc:Skp1-hydroxyproline GlcNAc-transferase) (Skp1 GlcNAc-Tase) (UDP-GlcNAc:hydroxyproline polypeptide GlcNAc-transferase) [Durusdinium trenchii]|uniref:Uncharacterized protein n=1 Tax=Durusdinium trenchii TaxID=1381693 RepID=A0ABP0IJC3_9DINO
MEAGWAAPCTVAPRWGITSLTPGQPCRVPSLGRVCARRLGHCKTSTRAATRPKTTTMDTRKGSRMVGAVVVLGVLTCLSNAEGVWSQVGADIDGEAAGDNSGYSVSLSSDGNTVAIGAVGNDGTGGFAGHVRVYRFQSSTWTQLGNDIDGESAGDNSGYSVSLSSNGHTVAIGAIENDGTGTDAGHVRVYRFHSSAWTQLGDDIDGESAGDNSGYSVSLSSDGTTVAIGAIENDGTGTDAGHVRVYRFQSSEWTQLGGDIDGEAANDESGYSVSLSSDGNTVAIGAIENDGSGPGAGHVRVFRFNSTAWQQVGADIDGEAVEDESGWSISLSSDGNTVAIGAARNDGAGEFAGHVRVYRVESSAWRQLGDDIDGEAVDDELGFSVSLSSDGNTVAIGAVGNDGTGTDAGHARVYRFNSTAWQQVGADIDGEAVEDESGWSISLSSDGNTVAIGAPFNGEGGNDAGHARVYRFVPLALDDRDDSHGLGLALTGIYAAAAGKGEHGERVMPSFAQDAGKAGTEELFCARSTRGSGRERRTTKSVRMGYFTPLGYHGNGKLRNFFEGWYIKSFTADKDCIAIVPGIFRGREESGSHAFIFVNINGKSQHYYRFPVDAFEGQVKDFDVTIAGKNKFSASGISVDLEPKEGDDATMYLSGELEFQGGVKWPITTLSPGVMGMVAFFPRVECYHGIVSMDHVVTGTLKLKNEAMDTLEFDGSGGSRGYLEKDWGKHFPRSWVWIQTNDFGTDTPTSLFFSAAQVPYFGTSFPGFICGFVHQGKLHRFTSYLLSKFKEFRVDEDKKTVVAVVANGSHRLRIETSYDIDMVELYGPHPPTGTMELTVPEGLQAEVKVRLETKAGELVFEGVGSCGGIEDRNIALVDGDWVQVADENWGRPHAPYDDRWLHNDTTTVMVLVAALRETRLAATLLSAFDNADFPDRVRFGVVQQNGDGDPDCVEEVCAERGRPVTKEVDPGSGAVRFGNPNGCAEFDRIRVKRMHSSEARGPVFARGHQVELLEDEDFCMQIDAHTVFKKGWDSLMLRQWAMTDNEFAVLSTYPTNYKDLNKNSNRHWEMPHICGVNMSPIGFVSNKQASAAANLDKPLLAPLWAAGLSFSRCHAVRWVPNDKNLKQVFSGEEFSRGARLWTHGYDFYSLSRPVIGVYYGNDKGGHGSWKHDRAESERSKARLMTLLQLPNSDQSTRAYDDLGKFTLGTRRTLDQYIAFSGVDTRNAVAKDHCIVKYVPWDDTGLRERILADERELRRKFGHQRPHSRPGLRAREGRGAFLERDADAVVADGLSSGDGAPSLWVAAFLLSGVLVAAFNFACPHRVPGFLKLKGRKEQR